MAIWAADLFERFGLAPVALSMCKAKSSEIRFGVRNSDAVFAAMDGAQ
jgi:hypothetical protein